jgi:signal transduction histidine kinase
VKPVLVIKEVARALQNQPALKDLSEQERIDRVEFVVGNFSSCIAVPLVARTTRGDMVDLRGALSLYSVAPETFDEGANEFYAELATCLTQAVMALRGDLAGELAYDVTALRATQERKRSEEALRAARADLARVTQMMATGEMAASIAHEINQPLAAIVSNGSAGLRWLASERPEVEEARAALKRVVSEGHAPSSTGRWVAVPATPGKETEPGLVVYRCGSDLFYANSADPPIAATRSG